MNKTAQQYLNDLIERNGFFDAPIKSKTDAASAILTWLMHDLHNREFENAIKRARQNIRDARLELH